MHSSNMAYNCIGIDTQTDFFKNIPNSTNKTAVGWEVFWSIFWMLWGQT